MVDDRLKSQIEVERRDYYLKNKARPACYFLNVPSSGMVFYYKIDHKS